MSQLPRRRRIPGWPRSVRARLTFWYITVFAVLILLFGAIFYLNLRASLLQSFDDDLTYRTNQIASGVNQDDGKNHAARCDRHLTRPELWATYPQFR